MSHDMSSTTLTERRRQILQAAIAIIAHEGYANLSRRALARASGMKLGALQYHFRTWEDLLKALSDFIAEEYSRAFDALAENSGPGRRPWPARRDALSFFFESEKSGFIHVFRVLTQRTHRAATTAPAPPRARHAVRAHVQRPRSTCSADDATSSSAPSVPVGGPTCKS